MTTNLADYGKPQGNGYYIITQEILDDIINSHLKAERERIEEVIQCATPFGIGVPQDPLISKFAVLLALTPTKTDKQ